MKKVWNGLYTAFTWVLFLLAVAMTLCFAACTQPENPGESKPQGNTVEPVQDSFSFTYKGTAETPFTIAVQEAVDANALGDVDGDGVITNLDALLLLYAINDKYNLTAEEFARADLNGDGKLWAAEALRILQYVSGVVGSVKM